MKTKSLLSLIALAMLCTTNVWGATRHGNITYSTSGSKLTISPVDGTDGVMGDFDNFDGSGSNKRPSAWTFGITEVDIKEGVTAIGTSAFQGMTYLATVHIPTTLTLIKERAFQGCTGVTNVYYADTPNQWAQIDFKVTSGYPYGHPFYSSNASTRKFYFYGNNTETTNIVFTPGLTTIKAYAFYKANNITNLNIPHSVTSIGDKAFYQCTKLCRIFVNNTNAPTTGTDVFYNIRHSTTYNNSSWLYLPVGANKSTSDPGFKRQPWYDSSNSGKGATCIGYQGTDKSASTASSGFEPTSSTGSKLYPTSGIVDGISWELDENGVMTFSGYGEITTTFVSNNSASDYLYPWHRFCDLVDKVVIKGGVTGLSNALGNMTALREITIAQLAIPTASSTLPTYVHGQKVNVNIDYLSAEDDNLSIAPYTTSSKWNIIQTTTFCAEPTGLTTSSVGTTSATFTWTDDRADTWKYLCLPAYYGAPYDEDWDDAISTNSNPTTVTGLTAGTTYVFYLKADCGMSESKYIYSDEFTTECSTIAHASLPWSENFDTRTSGANAPCWAENTSGDASVAVTEDQYYSSPKSLRLTGGSADNTAIVIFPEFVDDIKNLTLTFRYRASISSNYGTPELGYISDINDASTFVKVQDLAQTNWTQITNFFVPANTPNGARFAIRYTRDTNGSTGYTDIDDITVAEKPECVAPTNVAASSITNSGATISWDANDMSAWVLQVSEGDDEHWGEDINAATNSKALTELEDNTLYYVRVKANCGAFGDSDWSDAVSFRTECDAIDVDASTPWSENFNAMDEYIVPECWNNSASTTTSSWGANYIWGTYEASSNKMLRMSNGYLDGGIALINTPSFTLPNDANDYEFTFDYANRASSGNLLVKVSVDGGAFSQVGSYSNAGGTYSVTNPGEMTSAVISLSSYKGHTVKLQFYTTPAAGTNNNDGAIFADNVSVHKVPSCFQPTALAASSITANSAHLTWTEGGEETAWRLQYRAGAGEWSEEIAVNTTAAYDLTSLSANTTYEVRVKAWCSIDDFSEWSETASFTTLCAAESMPYSESFGLTTSLPTCWEASSNNWSGDYQSTNGFAKLHTGYSGTASLCTPPVDLSEDAILRFKWKNANGTAVNLYISTDRGETKTLITDELSDVQADWATKQYNLSAYTGEEAQFYFIATFSTQNKYAYLDDVEVFAIPTEVFLDNASATDNEDRLKDLMGQIANITINRPLLLNGDYCTLTLPFDLSASQIGNPECPLHGFTIKEFEHSRDASGEVLIYLKQVTSIEAGKPYFVRYAGAPSDDRLTPLVFDEVTIKASTPAEIENEDGCTPHGIFNPYPLTSGDESTLFLSSNNTLYWPSADGTMNGFRAYIKVDATGPLSAPIRRGAPIRIVEQENTATGIESVQPSEISIQKVLRDGQMIIIREGKEYNAQGVLIR